MMLMCTCSYLRPCEQVRGTVRSVTDDAKVAHLKALPGADTLLELFEADLINAADFVECVTLGMLPLPPPPHLAPPASQTGSPTTWSV